MKVKFSTSSSFFHYFSCPIFLSVLPPSPASSFFFFFSSPSFFYFIPYLTQEKQHNILWLRIRKFLWVRGISEVLPPICDR